MRCQECLYFKEQSGSYHGKCTNNYLTREDLTFTTEHAIKLFHHLDYPPDIIKDCKKFAKKPRCVKCGKLFDGEVGAIMYMHFHNEEFKGICSNCNNGKDGKNHDN